MPAPTVADLMQSELSQAPKFGGQVLTLALAGASQRTTTLAPGGYRVAANCGCWIKVGDDTVTAALAGAGNAYLGCGQRESIQIDDNDGLTFLAAIADTGDSGVISITKER